MIHFPSGQASSRGFFEKLTRQVDKTLQKAGMLLRFRLWGGGLRYELRLFCESGLH